LVGEWDELHPVCEMVHHGEADCVVRGGLGERTEQVQSIGVARPSLKMG
jgi:hypothetical protein